MVSMTIHETSEPRQPEQSSASARQTQSYLRTIFDQRGLRPKSKLGQNFLIDLNLLDLIVRRAELTREDLVLEVGSGTGGLTAQLLEAAGGVVSVEIDSAFAVMVREALPPNPRLELLHADALKNKNELNPDLLHAINLVRERTATTRVKLVANLPYAVATPVVTNLLLTDLPIERMIVTVQAEIGDRLIAHAWDQGLRSTRGAGAESRRRVDHPPFAAVGVLAAAEGVVHHRRHPPEALQARPHRRCPEVPPFPARSLHAPPKEPARRVAGPPSRCWTKEEVDRKLAELGIDGTTTGRGARPGAAPAVV